MVEHKPCPFCGGTPMATMDVEADGVKTFALAYVYCRSCGAQTRVVSCDRQETDHEIYAAEAWGRWDQRTPSTQEVDHDAAKS